MKIHISFNFEEGKGGGAHFLSALREELRRTGAYAEKSEQADTILFNSHNNLLRVLWLRMRFPFKKFIHRVDGPMSSYTERDDRRDKKVWLASIALAHGVVFQSEWSRQENYNLQIVSKNKHNTVIVNAPRPDIFYPKPSKNRSGKIQLIGSGWSEGKNKGFDTLTWIDEHLDWNAYEMTYVGRSPVKFKNIQMEGVEKPEELARLLRASDVYIFPSRIEACSNALLEALHSGLPAVYFDATSNPEIVGRAGVGFISEEDFIPALEKLVENYDTFVGTLAPQTLSLVADHYIQFAKSLR